MSEILPVEVRLQGDSVWLTQRQMAELLGTTTDNISLHLKNIYNDGELDEVATIEESSVVQQEGKRQVTHRLKLYNLDAIISVAYRVNSKRGVQFRQWATQVLREHLTRGFTLNRQRFEANARELEAALLMVRRLAGNPQLGADAGRGLADFSAKVATPKSVIPAKAGIQCTQPTPSLWIPAFAGMTSFRHSMQRSAA